MKYLSNITLTLMGLAFLVFAIAASSLPLEALRTAATILVAVTVVLVVAAFRVEKLIIKRRTAATA